MCQALCALYDALRYCRDGELLSVRFGRTLDAGLFPTESSGTQVCLRCALAGNQDFAALSGEVQLQKSRTLLDGYLIGSLDFNFSGNCGFSIGPTKRYAFCGRVNSNQAFSKLQQDMQCQVFGWKPLSIDSLCTHMWRAVCVSSDCLASAVNAVKSWFASRGAQQQQQLQQQQPQQRRKQKTAATT